MSRIRKLRIKSPELLLERLKIKTIPDMVKLGKKLEIEVLKYDPLSGGKALFDEYGNVKAMIQIEDKLNVRNILINNRSNLTSTRFFAAYLIALYQLYSKPKENFLEIVFNETIYDMKAYNYAMGLLIPDSILLEYSTDLKNCSDLAKKYQVSSFLMEEAIKRKIKKYSFEVIE